MAWIDNGDKSVVWSRNKGDTEANHKTIVANLKSAQWPKHLGKKNHNEGGSLKLMGSPETDLIIPEILITLVSAHDHHYSFIHFYSYLVYFLM